MTDTIFTPTETGCSYSIRACRKCSAPMAAREGRSRRVWECTNCGRKQR